MIEKNKSCSGQTKKVPQDSWREVIIQTNGNKINLVKCECSALELLTIFRELTKKIRRPLK